MAPVWLRQQLGQELARRESLIVAVHPDTPPASELAWVHDARGEMLATWCGGAWHYTARGRARLDAEAHGRLELLEPGAAVTDA